MASVRPTLTQGLRGRPTLTLCCLHWASMYAKTNPRAGRLTPRQKRIFAIAAVLVIVVFGGLAAWGAGGA